MSQTLCLFRWCLFFSLFFNLKNIDENLQAVTVFGTYVFMSSDLHGSFSGVTISIAMVCANCFNQIVRIFFIFEGLNGENVDNRTKYCPAQDRFKHPPRTVHSIRGRHNDFFFLVFRTVTRWAVTDAGFRFTRVSGTAAYALFRHCHHRFGSFSAPSSVWW